MQRTRQQQLAAARPRLSDFGWGAALVVGVTMAVVLIALVSLRFARRPALDPGCAYRYRQARTAADTAVVDAVGVPRKDPSFHTCGSQRRAVERGLGF